MSSDQSTPAVTFWPARTSTGEYLTDYLVGSDGTVLTCRGRNGKIARSPDGRAVWRRLPEQPHKQGYKRVTIRGKRRMVHQVVLESILCACPPGLQCLHRDGNPANNWSFNLHWGSRLENMADRDRHGRTFRPCGERHGNAKLTEERVRRILAARRAGEPCASIARREGVSKQLIHRIDSGKAWPHIPR